MSFILQGWRASIEATRRGLIAARVVRMELIRNVATAEVAVKVRRKMPAAARATFRRDAYDRLMEPLAPGLNDKYLSALVGFYSLHEHAADILFIGSDEEPDLGDEDAAWLQRWIGNAETAEAIINVAYATWWQRLIWRGHWREVDRRLAEENELADAEPRALMRPTPAE